MERSRNAKVTAVEKPLTKRKLGIPRNRFEKTFSWIQGKRLWDGSEENLAQGLGIRALEINDSATKTD